MNPTVQRSPQAAVGLCPECDAPVPLGGDPRLGQRVACPNCRARLTVINLNPLDLDWAFEEPLIRSVQEAEEDWASEPGLEPAHQPEVRAGGQEG